MTARPKKTDYEVLLPDNVFPMRLPTANEEFAAFLEDAHGAHEQALFGYCWSDDVVDDPDPDAPLSLAQAVCLPELGGMLKRNLRLSIASSNVTVKTLRKAIDDEELGCVRYNAKNLYVTRRQIKEWIEASCRSRSTTDRILSSAAPGSRQVNSPTVALTSSRTSSTEKPSVSTQDAVSELLKKLR